MATSSSDHSPNDDYEIGTSSIPGAGKGMFAKRPFAAGDCIIAEGCLCSVPVALNCDSKLVREPAAVEKAIDDLKATELDTFRALHGLNDHDKWGTNALLCASSPGSTHLETSGIFPTIARINHSCVPNAEAKFSGGLVNIRAERDIADGEEIFISYRPEMLEDDDREKRREVLKYFECRCPACERNMTIGQIRRERE